MSIHDAVVTVGVAKALEILRVPTVSPSKNEVRVRNEWTASTPLDLHQNDGALLVKHPQILGDGVAGTVVEVGPTASHLKVGDKVFGFTWRKQAEKAHQVYVTAPEYLFGKIPAGFSMQQAVVLPNNFVTAWHTLTSDFGFELPWPKPDSYVAPNADDLIVVWGGSSSVGMYALQILKWYGYKKLVATASKAHHNKLTEYGAAKCFDYREKDVVNSILEFVGTEPLPFVLDCIGSQHGSVAPISQIASRGTKVAVLLPVIVKDAAEGVLPEYEMDVGKCASWADGVDAMGVRTHFYLDNKFLAEDLQSAIMPAALAQGIVKPNEQVIVEGKTMLERAEKALSKLRRKEVSGGRLVWRVADD